MAQRFEVVSSERVGGEGRRRDGLEGWDGVGELDSGGEVVLSLVSHL